MILDKGTLLTKVHNYQLQTPKNKILIEIHEIILGSESKFVAVPVQALGMVSNNLELHISGNTEHEALEAFVEKIKEMPREEVFPKEKPDNA